MSYMLHCLQIAWALNKGVKQEYKQFWDVDLGVTYIPWEKVKLDDLDDFAEGGMIDQETVNSGEKNLLVQQLKVWYVLCIYLIFYTVLFPFITILFFIMQNGNPREILRLLKRLRIRLLKLKPVQQAAHQVRPLPSLSL